MLKTRIKEYRGKENMKQSELAALIAVSYTHLVIDYRKCDRLEIFANGSPMRLCTDGEITDARQVSFEIAPKAIRFLVPKGAGSRQNGRAKGE